MLNGDSGMDMEKLKAIKDLMDELVGEMEPSGEDFDMRLGKPKVDMVSMEGSMPMGEDEDEDSDDLFGGSPEDKLKERILKLKG